MTPRPLAALRAAALTITVSGAACATMQVRSHLERDADLDRYRTYTFASADTAATGDPRLDDNPFFTKRVLANVDAGLADRGFRKARGPVADLVVHYHASVSQEIELPTSDRGACVAAEVNQSLSHPPGCQPYVYDAGTLLIDLVDGRTKRLVWRGWAESNLDGVLDNQEWMNARVDESVRRILEQLPRPRVR